MMWRNIYRRPAYPRRIMWRNMRDLMNEMDFMLGGTRGPVYVKYPPVNAWNNDEGMIVTAEIPGVDPEELNISVVEETLTLSGARKSEDLPENAQYHRRERGSGQFNRTIQLPYKVDVDNVSANFDNGVLRIELPRLPEEKPRKITVKMA